MPPKRKADEDTGEPAKRLQATPQQGIAGAAEARPGNLEGQPRILPQMPAVPLVIAAMNEARECFSQASALISHADNTSAHIWAARASATGQPGEQEAMNRLRAEYGYYMLEAADRIQSIAVSMGQVAAALRQTVGTERW